MTVLITGVNGFIGTHLARHWSSLGYTVYGTARHWPDPPAGLPLHRRITFDLGGEIRPEDLAGADVVVHLAYDRKAGIELNLEGVKRVFAAATAAGVPRQIFVSSYSARPMPSPNMAGSSTGSKPTSWSAAKLSCARAW